ncbi:hypothetical protein, partial [Sansalvadorimonas verongulae]|uniref:hypothetical protein n=1 Tax=Sansalvadorimonas verongulae TaxID=2172824 RepID=UPI001E4F08C1
EGSTCSATISKVHSLSAADDPIITGESVDGFSLPFNSDIHAWEIHCRKVVKQEIEEVYEAESIVPDDLDYGSPTPEVEISSQNEKETVRREKRNTTCPCGT